MTARKNKRKTPTTDDGHIEGVKRIDAPPEDIARALFGNPSVAGTRRKRPLTKRS